MYVSGPAKWLVTYNVEHFQLVLTDYVKAEFISRRDILRIKSTVPYSGVPPFFPIF